MDSYLGFKKIKLYLKNNQVAAGNRLKRLGTWSCRTKSSTLMIAGLLLKEQGQRAKRNTKYMTVQSLNIVHLYYQNQILVKYIG